MVISVILLFKVVDFGDTGNYVYYLTVVIIYFLSYMLWMTPYTALGSEMTLDYDERTRLRTPATIFQGIGNIVGMSLPMGTIAFMIGMGVSDTQAWNYFAIILGVVCLISVLITWRTTKGKELPAEVVFSETTDKNPVKSYLRFLTLKPIWWMIGIGLLFFVGYTVYQSGLTYYVLYCTGMTEAQMSTAMFINIFIGVILTILISYATKRLDKKTMLGICFLISAAGMVATNIIGISSMTGLVILFALFNVGNVAYWLLVYPIQYDVAEVYDYKYGDRKEASVYTLMALLGSLSASLGVQVLTRSLAAVGYDMNAMEQSADVISGISMIILLIPAGAFTVAAVCCFMFPISRRKYEILMEQKTRKQQGMEVDESQLKGII